jgi:UDP-N-acetylmuramoylalanine--D-glutamate ligase
MSDRDLNLAGMNVLVMGLGETGLSMAQWVTRQGAHEVRVADTRADPPGRAALGQTVPNAALHVGAFEHAHLQGIDLVAISPGVPLALPLAQEASRRGLPIVGDIELFARAIPSVYADRKPPTLIGVTGTNGKTTVTALTGALLQGAGVDAEMAGNISPAALSALMHRLDTASLPDAWVLELSSYQLETTCSLDLDAATMLNLSEDHLDRYSGMAAYGAAKARIFAGTGLQVLNRDDTASLAMHREHRRVMTFGLNEPHNEHELGLLRRDAGFVLAQGVDAILPTEAMQLAGLHNAANALAALALVSELDLPRAALVMTLRTFRGLPHRVEPIASVDGVTYYNDSKGTNVGSTVAALTGFAKQLAGTPARVILIAGGDGKGQNFTPLRSVVDQVARAVVLIGRDGPRIGAAITGTHASLKYAASMREAIELAQAAAQFGDIVLLSPACASFDMFDNYKHRGEVFAQTVRALPHAERR